MTNAVAHSLSGEKQPAIRHIEVPTPVMGGKAWLLDDKGLFVLERGRGTLITLACTHAGAGGIEIIDGVVLSDEEWTPQNVSHHRPPPSLLLL